MFRYRWTIRGRLGLRGVRLDADLPGSTLVSGTTVRTLARIAGVAGLVLGVSGCLDLVKPELAIDIPGSYRAPHGPAEAATPTLDWWRSFRSREFTALMEEAITANFDIAVAIAQITQADAQVRIAGAPLLPSLSLGANDTASKASEQLTASSGIVGGRSLYSRTYTSSLSASYVLDFWGKNRAALDAAIETSIASRYNKEVVQITALSSVANAYFQILAARDRLRIARENLDAASDILDKIKERFKVGTASDLNVAQQETLVEQVRASIPPLQLIIEQNTAALALLVGKAPEHFGTRGPGMSSIALPRVTPGLPSDLINRRPDIRQAEEQLKSAGYAVESARAAFFPTIQLTGQLGFESAALRSLFGPGAWFYTAAAGLTQPIFDGGVLLGTFEQQKGLQAQYLQAYRKSVLSGFSNVEQALAAMQRDAQQERAQENVVRAAQRAYDRSREQFDAGTIDMVTLLQVEQTLFTAKDQLALDRLARLQAVVSLFQALGGGWPPATPAQAHAQNHAL
jgi:NodT family efflux transporter outer membrane factor (OMF) lipoprotein